MTFVHDVGNNFIHPVVDTAHRRHHSLIRLTFHFVFKALPCAIRITFPVSFLLVFLASTYHTYLIQQFILCLHGIDCAVPSCVILLHIIFAFLPLFSTFFSALNTSSLLSVSNKVSLLWSRHITKFPSSIRTQSSTIISHLPLFTLFTYSVCT